LTHTHPTGEVAALRAEVAGLQAQLTAAAAAAGTSGDSKALAKEIDILKRRFWQVRSGRASSIRSSDTTAELWFLEVV
jgi:hypothetical protein